MKTETVETDILIVGAGSAGIMAAIRAQERGSKVLLITNGALGKDSAVTWMAGGGFECALYPPDSPEAHARDTIRNGSYINYQELVLAILKEGLETASQEIEKIKVEKLPQVCTAAKHKRFNQEWVQCLEIENMITCIEMTILGALTRTESRGLHFRDDYPRNNPDWIKNVVIKKDGDRMAVDVQPVPFPYFKPREGGER
jgi:succinate dehydrogenase/fumarate reductase flavoprotein subunit